MCRITPSKFDLGTGCTNSNKCGIGVLKLVRLCIISVFLSRHLDLGNKQELCTMDRITSTKSFPSVYDQSTLVQVLCLGISRD